MRGMRVVVIVMALVIASRSYPIAWRRRKGGAGCHQRDPQPQERPDFTGQSVEKEKLDKILRAAMAAPTAVNKQPWSFVVVTERKTLNTLRDGLPYAKMLGQAGAAIVVCAIPARAYDGMVEFAIIDSSLAGENILLAAEALGLGATWTAAYPYKDRMDVVRRALSVPESVIPLNVIPIGYPTGADKPKSKYKPENIHWEKW
jgi:nitroreductase